MRKYTLSKPSLGKLFTIIESQHEGIYHIFRGQGCSKWGLIPSLYREQVFSEYVENIEKSFDLFEDNIVKQFFREGLPYLNLPSLERGYTNDRILAQHFGVRTRFLDWSTDPLVALFFAVERCEQKCNECVAGCDAAIFMLLPDDSYRPEDLEYHLTGIGDPKAHKKIDFGRTKRTHSLEEHKSVYFPPPAIDLRIPAQKSVFTFHPYGNPDGPFVALDKREDMSEKSLAKIVIPHQHKGLLLRTLLRFGIDRRNLFPGLGGVGEDIAARIKLRVLG